MYVDTNVLVRLVTGDVASLREEAIRQIEACKKDEIVVHPAVLVELAFVLEYHDYKMKRTEIAQAMRDILGLVQVVSDVQLIRTIELYERHPKLDFTDALLIDISKRNVMSFDIELKRVIALS